MTAKMTRNILLMLVATVLMGIVLNLYIHNTGTVPAADNAAPLTDGSYTSSAQGCLSEVTLSLIHISEPTRPEALSRMPSSA